MKRTAAIPLNSDAVKASNNQFYANHEEMFDKHGNRIPLSSTNSAHADMRKEWMDLYLANGGKLEGEENEEGSNDDPTNPVTECSSKKKKEETVPTIKARWAKESVLPDHNSSRPPATPPTDTIPEDAKVDMIVETTDVPDGTKAKIQIHRCKDGAKIPSAEFTNLEVKGNKVVDSKTGKPPCMVFSAQHKPWDPWDCPLFYFKVQVEYKGLSTETPKNFKTKEKECLRVTYMHMCFSESFGSEAEMVNGILDKHAHSKALREHYGTMNTATNIYGSHIRNTYIFHQDSHGNVRNRKTGVSIGTVTKSQPPDDVKDPKNWRSVVSFTPLPRFGDAEVSGAVAIPSTPRYLWYSSTCLTGWESSFADAVRKRGTLYVIAFRRTIGAEKAKNLSKKFYKKWVGDHRLNPHKIPDCFLQIAGDDFEDLWPVLFGPGGKGIKPGLSGGEIALIAIGAVVGGLLVGVALYALLK